jgi:nucleoid-associated protein YgaU
VLGYGAYRNYQKMNVMEETLAEINAAQTAAVVETDGKTDGVKIEDVAGSVEPEPDTAEEETETQETQAVETEEPETNEPEAEESNPDDGQPQNENMEQTSDGEKTATENIETMEEVSESSQYLEQGYYIVQKGDNLAQICRKIYQSTAMQDKLCEANGIDDPDSIYAGQYLTLPD